MVDDETKYQASVALSNNESNLIWANFNTQLLMHSILIAAIATLWGNSNNQILCSYLAMILTGIGLLAICIGNKMLLRPFYYQDCYIIFAKKLENKNGPLSLKRARKEFPRIRDSMRGLLGLFVLVYIISLLLILKDFYQL